MSGRSACLALLAVGCLAMRLFASGSEEPSARNVLDTGHVGRVRSIAYDGRTGLLLSGGEDGTLRFWDVATRSTVRTLKVTQLGIAKIAVDPSGPRVAAVITDGTGAYQLSVWDWEKESQLYRLSLKESPLFVRFSAMGTYLFYGVSSWQSLTVLRAADGSPFEFRPEGFGIVGFAEMSRSERTLMTYGLSGRITYWDLSTGQQTVDVPAVPYLSTLAISADRRFIAGSTGSEVDVLDAVTGAMKSRVAVGGAASLDFAPSGDEIACLSTAGNAISRWSIASASAVQTAGAPSLGAVPTMLVYGGNALFAATGDGRLAAMPSGGKPALFGESTLAGVTGLNAAAGVVALGARDWVRMFSSDILTGAVAPTFIATQLRSSPFGGQVGLGFLADGRLLTWRADSTAVAVASGSGPFVDFPTAFRAPLSELRAGDGTLVGIEADGTVRLVDLGTGMSRFELRVPGVSAALQSGRTEIVVARNSLAMAAGSLLRVNTVTGETVTVKDRNVFTWGLALDQSVGGPVLYSVGIDAAGATNLIMHDGPGFDHETLLDSAPSENLGAGLSLDPSTHRLYALLGRDRVVRWDGTKLVPLCLQDAAPVRLLARDNLLFVLNKDSTVTVAATDTGERLAEIALFSDGEWAILLRDGKYAASTGGDLHVRVFAAGVPVKATEDFRLRIPIQEGGRAAPGR